MDVLESNSMATSMTPHPCKGNTCDKAGCNFNPYAKGDRNFWGPGKTVDSGKPVTVITQFVASGGKLTQVVRKYIQNGRQINSGTTSSCGAEGTYGGLTGMGQALGRGSKSNVFPRNHSQVSWPSYPDLIASKTTRPADAVFDIVVLAMSIWNDAKEQMQWLDQGSNGPCPKGQGTPANIQSQHSDTHVVFSNIRWGDIGSTTKS